MSASKSSDTSAVALAFVAEAFRVDQNQSRRVVGPLRGKGAGHPHPVDERREQRAPCLMGNPGEVSDRLEEYCASFYVVGRGFHVPRTWPSRSGLVECALSLDARKAESDPVEDVRTRVSTNSSDAVACSSINSAPRSDRPVTWTTAAPATLRQPQPGAWRDGEIRARYPPRVS